MGEPRPFSGALVPQTHPLVSFLKAGGTWRVTDLSQASRAAASLSFMRFSNFFFCSCYSASLVFLIFVLTSMFISTSAIFLSLFFLFFFFYALLFPLFEQRPIKREELNNSKMSCYNINLLCCWEWWKDGSLESYCLLESKLCYFLCNCGASYSSSKLIFLCPPPVYKTGYSIKIVPNLQCCEFSVI